jgi:hypothetical protein
MTAPVRLAIRYGYSVLQCPRGCSYGGNLHHSKIEVFERIENAEFVNKTTMQDKLTAVGYEPNENSDNPSSRRHALRIHFYCEGCGDGLTLNIAQHKGSTLMDWLIDPPSSDWLECERAILELMP